MCVRVCLSVCVRSSRLGAGDGTRTRGHGTLASCVCTQSSSRSRFIHTLKPSLPASRYTLEDTERGRIMDRVLEQSKEINALLRFYKE